MSPTNDQYSPRTSIQRITLWYAVLCLVMGIFLVRAFYVQVIRYDYYHNRALSGQLKQYEIPAKRGIISAYQGNNIVPIVLNQKLYTIYADPMYVKDVGRAANALAAVVGGRAEQYMDALKRPHTRYVIIAKKIPEARKKQLLAYKIPGLGAQEQQYRTYPQGALAAQLLGFVNDEGVGKYGIEQALNSVLNGTPGELKAITDASGVPLAASGTNIEVAPKAGSNVVLTIDIGMQKQLERILGESTKKYKAEGASAIIMDPHTGAVKAMANYPSYNPDQYSKVSNAALFQNAAVSHPIEIGSIMKTLVTAATLDQGLIQPNTTYYDPASWVIDKFRIKNIEEDGGPGVKSIAELLNLSLNTGATWELMQMGGGEINAKARTSWYDYMTNHFRFSKKTGIEQGYEASGYVPEPKDNGAGINLTYANTSFGQAMTATTLQAGAALSAVLNGGTFYKPHLIAQTENTHGKMESVRPTVLRQKVVSAKVSADMVPLMQYVVDNHFMVPRFDQSRYSVGGKTGTAQIAKPTGGYDEHNFNGTYLGFVGGDRVEYVISVFVHKPQVLGYAGSGAAQPIFAKLAHMLIDNAYVTPKAPR